ncbi:thymidine kinase [Candidatus Collierbacteria bacterium]|nr:thymidine kinase [Candidatus Collierbacteria bacterium]
MPNWPEHWTEKQGMIEVTAGPMFAGKSDFIINRAERFRRRGVSTYIVKHPLDTRYEGPGKISSHNGRSVDCEALAKPADIFSRVSRLDPCIVIIDEVQFYIDCQTEFVEMVRQFAAEGRVVMLAGLNMDFKGEPFGPMAVLMAIADQVNKLTAICSECGAEAPFTQRLINGEPASADSQLVVVGAEEAYVARCRRHHEVPGKNKFADLFG